MTLALAAGATPDRDYFRRIKLPSNHALMASGGHPEEKCIAIEQNSYW
jgi:hypothetical protein